MWKEHLGLDPWLAHSPPARRCIPTVWWCAHAPLDRRAHGKSAWAYIRSGSDPTTVAVMMEDGGAVAGLAIAGEPWEDDGVHGTRSTGIDKQSFLKTHPTGSLVRTGACTAAAHMTGNAMWDAVGSILVSGIAWRAGLTDGLSALSSSDFTYPPSAFSIILASPHSSSYFFHSGSHPSSLILPL